MGDPVGISQSGLLWDIYNDYGPPRDEKTDGKFSRFDTIHHVTDGRTDGQTPQDSKDHAKHSFV